MAATGAMRPRLGCLFLFQEFIFWTQKTVPARIPEDFFFSCVFRSIFSQERGFGEVAGIPVFFRFYRNFSQEFLWDRNSCIYPGISRIPAGIPVFTPESSGFRRIPVPAKSCWLWSVTKEGSLLSKIWTKIDIVNLSPGGEQDLTMVLPPSSAGASWPEGEGCRRGRGGCIDGGSAGGCRIGDDNCNGRCRQQQTTNNNTIG